MAQQYGLGRGLASLIPPKKKTDMAVTPAPESVAPFTWSSGENFPVSPAVALDTQSTHRETETEREVMDVHLSAPRSVPETALADDLKEISVSRIVPNPKQPRLHFDAEKLEELANSIREHGIVQPLVVTRVGENYELIAGERRLQAAKQLGLEKVPVVVRDVSEQEKLELAIIENIQRHNLSPIEEARAYLRLVEEFHLPQEAVAKKMGKSRSSVANTLRLLQLPIEMQRAIGEGKISEGHAKALLAIENPEKQRAVFELILREELTVRETEQQVRSIAVKPYVRKSPALHPELAERTEHLMQILGTKVKIAPAGKGGKVLIEYYSPEDLDGLLRRLEE